MIKFRQKEYSSRGMKLVRGIKKALNRADTAFIDGSLKAQEKLGISKGGPIASRVMVAPKTNYQINRETIKTVRGAQKTGRKIIETPLNEGLDSGIKYLAGNPISGVTALAPIPGSTAAGIIGEKALKSKIPAYSKATSKFQEGYSGSGFSKGLKKFRLPSIKEISNNLPAL